MLFAYVQCFFLHLPNFSTFDLFSHNVGRLNNIVARSNNMSPFPYPLNPTFHIEGKGTYPYPSPSCAKIIQCPKAPLPA